MGGKASRSFQDLVVWQKGHQMVLQIYKQSSDFPQHEIYCLTQQLRRSAISVPANIAEGFKKRGKSDKARFFNIAQGSLEETRYPLLLAKDLGYFENNELFTDIEEISRLLGAYSQRILTSAF